MIIVQSFSGWNTAKQKTKPTRNAAPFNPPTSMHTPPTSSPMMYGTWDFIDRSSDTVGRSLDSVRATSTKWWFRAQQREFSTWGNQSRFADVLMKKGFWLRFALGGMLKGTVDSNGLQFHWRLVRSRGRCTLVVRIGELRISNDYPEPLTHAGIRKEARKIARRFCLTPPIPTNASTGMDLLREDDVVVTMQACQHAVVASATVDEMDGTLDND
jgi:hypothetical protein